MLDLVPRALPSVSHLINVGYPVNINNSDQNEPPTKTPKFRTEKCHGFITMTYTWRILFAKDTKNYIVYKRSGGKFGVTFS